jgi:hypothetical protein
MDVQMVIPILTIDTPVESCHLPVVVAHTNVSVLSVTVLRDPNLFDDLQRYARLLNVELRRGQTYQTAHLLQLLLSYQTSSAPQGDAAISVGWAIAILKEAWFRDIERWSLFPSLSVEDVSTGELIYSHLDRFVKLILQPLLEQRAYVRFNKKGDMVGECEPDGFLRLCRLHSYRMSRVEQRLELSFYINNQIKGLFVPFNDIKRFEKFGVYFQHPGQSDCVLMSPFAWEEFIKPHPRSESLKRDLDTEVSTSSKVLAREEPSASSAAVCLQLPPFSLTPSLFSGIGLTAALNRAKVTRHNFCKRRWAVSSAKAKLPEQSQKLPVIPKRNG